MRTAIIAVAFVFATAFSASAATPVQQVNWIIAALDQYSEQVCPKQENPLVCTTDVTQVQIKAQQALINLGEIGLAVMSDAKKLEADARRNFEENLSFVSEDLGKLKAKYGKVDQANAGR